ncbi:zinc finger-containing protein [Microthyrium microscopicum]|uniref:Zinc finger-containing protein n=1 Tax=Microthyrium microscopicum TaxID=703497 RepID=A0A6A6U9X2_9PEZI|nr:zinc finger-containing protein [Microthyrium microscopicum]
MAPKGKDQPKAKDKVAIDKTFGMKNKKGSVAQKVKRQIEATAASGKTPDQKRKDAEKAQREREKAAAEQAKREAAELFKPVQVQKVPFGVDPKTVLCQFFKAGNCEKGKKCKFSHDLTVERKVEKKSLYTDTNKEEKEKDEMANWDEEKLREVVKSKGGNPRTTTDKVCKFFIEAVENEKYGWFWNCPNGNDKCMYRHNLPPGFKLRTKAERAAELANRNKNAANAITLEDFLDNERHRLTGDLTPITPDSFAIWKKNRMDKKAAEIAGEKMKDATGKAMFERGELAGSDDEDDEDDGAWNLAAMRRETEALRLRKEEERMAALNGVPLESIAEASNGPGVENSES